MLKNILNLEGVQVVAVNEQKEIAGGRPRPMNFCIECNYEGYCPTGYEWQPSAPGSINTNGICCPIPA